MDPRALGLWLALLAACSGRPADDGGGDACPDSSRDPILLKRIQGAWQVRHTFFELGRKPPGLALVGELTIEGCRFTFAARKDAALGQLAGWLPFVRWGRGVVAIVADAAPAPRHARELSLGAIRLHADPRATSASEEDAPTSIELVIHERVQEGEFLSMTTTGREPSYTFAIERGSYVRRPDEIPPSVDPDTIVTPIDSQEVRELDARWRREAADRAALRSPASR